MSPSNFFDSSHFLDETPDSGGGAVTPVPQTVPNLLAWYDAGFSFDNTIIGGILAGDGTVIDSWPDRSGRANNATKEDDPSRPEFLHRRIGEPSRVHFGETRWLNLPNSIATLTDFTMFFLYKSDEPDPINTVIAGMSADGLHINFWLTLDEQGRLKYQQGTSPSPLGTFTGVRQNSSRANHILTVRRNGNTVTLRNDSFNEGHLTLTAPDTGDGQLAILGNTPGGSGHGVLMGEGIIYDRALTDVEIQTIESYLMGRYNLLAAMGSLQEMTGGIPAPSVMNYVSTASIVDAIASERAFPMTVPDCLTWFDATRVLDVNQLSPGDKVATWKSSLGAPGVELNAFQATDANKPLIEYPGVGGKPRMNFEASTARMRFNSGLETAGGVTIFAVARNNTTGGAAFGAVIAGATKDDSGTNIPWLLAFTSANKIRWAQADATHYMDLVGANALDTSKYHIITARRSTQADGGKNVTLRVDGKEELNTTPAFDASSAAGVEAWMANAAPNVSSSAQFGYPLQGNIGDFIFYNRVLTDAEMYSVEEFLRRKWATDIAIG